MLQELTITPATVVIALVLLAWAIWAVRRLFHRGMCDCDDHCGGCSQKKDSAKCGSCSAADEMVAKMEKAAKRSDGGR